MGEALFQDSGIKSVLYSPMGLTLPLWGVHISMCPPTGHRGPEPSQLWLGQVYQQQEPGTNLYPTEGKLPCPVINSDPTPSQPLTHSIPQP